MCASAIGYYGNRGNNELSEKDDKGSDFISMVCDEWEKSAQIALKNDIRTVLLRIGIVLSPMGGALKRLLFPFNFRFGTKIGSGSQYMSWVTIDDVLGAINHILHNESLKGAVNIVSPYPVTNAKFVKILAGILEHNIIFTIPEALINLVFKDMGREVLLSSTRAMPEKLINSGYRFRYSELEHALKHLLGRKSV